MKPSMAMVATSQPLAVESALTVLRDGGNAVDAAVCASAVLSVVEPMSMGLGGDCFALVYDARTRALHGLNGSGRAPRAASLDDLARRGHATVPIDGILPVTVPGALHAWEALVSRLGTRTLDSLLDPAIQYARDGFELTPIIARDWSRAAARLRASPSPGAASTYLVGGERAPRAGERFAQSDLARVLETIRDRGTAAFYGGPIGDAIAAESRALDGWLAAEDLRAHESDWVEPISTRYRDATVCELPPNGQGIVALEALRILDGIGDLATLDAASRLHLQIEAVKLAFADAWQHVCDPRFSRVGPGAFLTDAYVASRRALITERALAPYAPHGFVDASTAHVSVVDADGNAASVINSVYHHFGSAVVARGTGIVLQSRGALFSTDPAHPNALAGGKRPYHTIIPALALRDGEPWLCFGIVGGTQQPQAHVQLLVNLLDRSMELQDAIDAPRFRVLDPPRSLVALERGIDATIGRALAERGHEIVLETPDESFGFGGAQAILIDRERGVLVGGSDRRKDGCARLA